MAAPAFDRRRVNGPDQSFPPVFDDELQPAAASMSASSSKQAFESLEQAAAGYRRTTRAEDDLRPICACFPWAACCRAVRRLAAVAAAAAGAAP